MDLVHAAILGFLQGIAEWLPISSQGQVMAFALAFLEMDSSQALNIAIFLHIGTVIAAAIYYRRELLSMAQRKEPEKTRFIGIAFLSTAITAVPLYFLLKQFVESFQPGIMLLAIALLLAITGLLQIKKKLSAKKELSDKNALLLGLGQGLAVLPGISRSGITSTVLLFRGFKPDEAFHLSFLLSVPSVIAAEIALGLFEGFEFGLEAMLALVVAGIVGYASIATLIKIAKKINFAFFCFVFAAVYALIAIGYLI